MEITIHGRRFQVTETHKAFWESVEAGKWEPYTFDVLDKYVPLHDNYIDVGAWIGPTVLYASRLCKSCSAFEPDPVAFKDLRDNADPHTYLFPVAISDYEGELVLGSECFGNSMTRVSAAVPGFDLLTVPCRTLETAIAGLHGSMFIKMDVEGAEELILRDIEFFKKHKPTLYLSLHPRWFRDPTAGMITINNVGGLYKHTHLVENNTILFTDLD